MHYLATTLVTSGRTYSYNERLAKFQRSKFVDNSKVSFDGYLQFLKKGNSVLLKAKSEIEGYDVWGEYPGIELFSRIIEVEDVDPSDPKQAEKAVDDMLTSDSTIKEQAESQGHDILKRITSKRAWIITGLSIAGIAAGIGAKVWYDHSKKKKNSKE